MKKINAFLTIVSVVMITLYSCKTEKKITTTNVPISIDCSVKVNYSAIKEIMDASCIKCHSGSKPKRGIDLTTYENVKSAVNLNLLCSVKREKGCAKMPMMSQKLSIENINKIDCWIQNGMLK